MLSFWLAFEASKASVFLQISSIVTNFKKKQSEESLASLILRTLTWSEKFSIAFRTGSSLKSDKMGRSILRVSTIVSQWSLNFLTASFSSVITLSPSIRVIRYSVSLVSKIWFDSFPKFSIIGYSIHMEIIVENLLRFPQKLNTKISLSFMGKEISSTIIFPIFIKKASPSRNCFSELFIYEGRLVTSNMFFLFLAVCIKYFRGNVFKFSRVNILDR